MPLLALYMLRNKYNTDTLNDSGQGLIVMRICNEENMQGKVGFHALKFNNNKFKKRTLPDTIPTRVHYILPSNKVING